tara:strand:+ start:990 stop:1433 length:444 start_codon:yes stop_codon:yes gene_type:complete
MALSLSQIRSALATQILNITGMRLARHLPDYFGRVQDTVAHKAFTVQIDSVIGRTDERQRRAIGVYAQTTVTIKFCFRLRPLDVYPTDYDSSLDLEVQLIDQVLKSYASIQQEVQIRFVSSDRQSTNSNEYMITTLVFNVFHTIKHS